MNRSTRVPLLARHRAYLLSGILAAALLAGPASTQAAANEYDDKDLSVRMASAFIRFTEISAFGGETAANRWSPAVNPAAADWTHVPSRHGVVLAPYYSSIGFDDVSIDLYGEAGLWDTRRYGSFQPTLSQLRGNDATDRQGLGFGYETDTYQLQWGLRRKNRAIGAALNFNRSKVTQSAGPLEISRTTADTYRVRLGGLWEPRRRLLLGAVAEYGWSPFDFNALIPNAAGGFIPISGSDTQKQVILRAAASYEYREMSTISVDYQYGWFENDRSTLKTHRFSAGVQHRVLEFLFARLGATTDQYGNAGYSAGVTIPFSRWGQVDVGYQRGGLPELQTNFGDSEVLQVILSVRL